MRRLLILAPLLLAAREPPQGAAMIPETIRAMLDAALAAGDDGDVATIVKYARAADPVSGDAVLAIADRWRADRAVQRRQVIRQASVLDLWSGRAELGGFLTTGNAPTVGATAVVDLGREGLEWRHKLHAQADYQENRQVATREHYLLSYEPNYKFDARAYLYGAAQYESDRFLGYDDRVSGSLGAGYSAVKTAAVKLDLELGPAFRHTGFTDDTVQNALAGRGSVDFSWRLTPALSVTQVASAYLQRVSSTVSGTTALNAKLLGPLTARLSYQVQYESAPAAGSVSTDTTSRAALVYSF